MFPSIATGSIMMSHNVRHNNPAVHVGAPDLGPENINFRNANLTVAIGVWPMAPLECREGRRESEVETDIPQV
jgi:hypothetical protein